MRFIYYPSNLDFQLKKDQINYLVIENSKELLNVLQALIDTYDKKGESIGFIKENEPYNFNKNACLIMSLRDIDYANKSLQKNLIKTLIADTQTSELSEELLELRGRLVDLIDHISFNSEFEIEYDEINLEALFKTLKVRFKVDEGNFLSKLIEYIKLNHRLLRKEVFVFSSMTAIFTEEELKYLLEFALYENITLLFIESAQIKSTIRRNEYIIDSDLCELR